MNELEKERGKSMYVLSFLSFPELLFLKMSKVALHNLLSDSNGLKK